MKILFINSVCGIGSTGRICTDLAQQLEKEGHTVKIAYGRSGTVPEKFQKYAVRIGTDLDVKLHALQTRLFDTHGFGSKRATQQFLKWADAYNPDLVWLHNIHGYYINVEMLFAWLKSRPQTQVKWTLHDCWAFTGHCSHFTIVNCDKWQTHCSSCPQKQCYPASFTDNSNSNFDRKKAAFTGVKNMTIVCVSHWLENLVKQSFLKEYPVQVVHNTIDTTIFKPTPSDFRQKYGLENKKIILGVANIWGERKGLQDFIKLARMLDDKYAIVLVGLTDKQIKNLPKQIIGLKRVNDVNPLTVYAGAETGVPSCQIEDVGEHNNIEDNKITNSKVIVHGAEHIYEAITGYKYKADERKYIYKIICIARTNTVMELVKIYSAADVFVNPTYEDNYPTVNLEAQACGTPVITYDTGGCKETVCTKS